MKIAIVGRYYNRQGGVSGAIAALSDRAGAEHEVDIYANQAFDIAGSPAQFVHVPMIERPSWLQVPTFSLQLRKRLTNTLYDIVHVHDDQGLNADVITAHSCAAAWFDFARREAGFPRAQLSRIYPAHAAAVWWERFTSRRSDAPIIAVSRKTADELKRYLGVDPSRVRVIYNGVDTERFRPPRSRAAARKQLEGLVIPQHADAVVLAFIGYSFRRKGLGRAIEALARAGDQRVELWVAGPDDPEPYNRLARELGVAEQVRFLGHRSDVVTLMQAADAFIFPTSYDPFPLVLMEAIACGTPVITSRVAGIAEVMADGQEGFLLDDPLDVDELTAALTAFLGQQDRWPQFGSAARELSLQWNWGAIWKRTEAVYDEVCERKRAQPRN